MAKSDKKEIIEKVHLVALDMIKLYGLRGLNMLVLAKECNLAKATLYKVIGSKELLVCSLADDIYHRNSSIILGAMMGKDNPEDAVTDFLIKYLDYASDYQSVLCRQIYREYPLIEKKFNAIFASEMKLVINVFEKWQQEGLIKQEVNISYCFESLNALKDFYGLSSYTPDEVRDRIQMIFRCVFSGMGIQI